MDLVQRAIGWAGSQEVKPLDLRAVPGTSEEERRSLAALGGLARALAGSKVESWPAPLSLWALRGPELPSDLVDAIRRELAGGHDVVARLYEELVSGRNRRRLGTFFTPPALVDFMFDRAETLIQTPKVIIDPGAGVGAFSLAARRRWPEASVVAVDVNLVTLGLLAARADSEVDLVVADYLAWASGDEVPAESPRLWIGNPPYTRHQELSRAFKERAIAASGGLVMSGLAGLSTYFLAVTLNALGPDDVMCFLLPGSWTDARYGRELRDALGLLDRPLEFVGFSSDLDVFPGTRVTAMVAIVGGTRSAAEKTLRTTQAKIEPAGVVTGRSTAHDRATRSLEDLGTWLWQRKTSTLVDGTPLGNIATVRRGVATGANEYFLLTNEARAKFPEAATVRAIRRLRMLSGDRLTLAAHSDLGAAGERCWLVKLSDADLLGDSVIAQWKADAEEAGIHKRYLTSHREPWYVVEDVKAPDVIVSPMGKGRFRVVVNEARAIPSNALYGIYLGGDEGFATRLTSWLNSPDGQIGLLERARAYGAGLFKLEPKDLLRVLVPHNIGSEIHSELADERD